MRCWAYLLIVTGLLLLLTGCAASGSSGASDWSEDEKAVLKSLWIGSLPPPPPDPSNRVAGDPRAARLGQRLFFDRRFSANGMVSCATCHIPEKLFQDGLQLGHGIGTANRRTMTVIGAAYSPWQFWDGHKDSLWAQVTGPLENAVEHGGNRAQYARLVAQHYRAEYEEIFGPLPDLATLPENAGPVADPSARAAWDALPAGQREDVSRVFANIGKAIAAYERKLVPGASRFDHYAEAVLAGLPPGDTLTSDEIAGLRLFTGKAGCVNCHNGPLFTNFDFHNTGVPAAQGLPTENGRSDGARLAQADEFNCLGPFSDAAPEDCAELRFMIAAGDELQRRFKVPSLRNVAARGPYMHAGQFQTLEEVLNHYNRAPASGSGHSELEPLGLRQREMQQIIAFLKTLDSPVDADPAWLSAPE